MNDWPELLFIDKPHGITSFDVIRRLRRAYSDTHGGQKAPKLGHAGTLDPLATGLMLLGVGRGTKQLASLIKLDKEYIAEIRLGESRTTGDMEGEVVATQAVVETVAELEPRLTTALAELVGTHALPVSAYSAIKVDGVPMYKRARQAALEGGVVDTVPVRDMVVYEAELLGLTIGSEQAVATVRFHVASGTYIRSLAEELGRRLGYPACLQNLRRTKVGEFSIENALQIENLGNMSER